MLSFRAEECAKLVENREYPVKKTLEINSMEVEVYEDELEEGKVAIPFQFEVPKDTQPSFVKKVGNEIFGNITTVTVTIEADGVSMFKTVPFRVV